MENTKERCNELSELGMIFSFKENSYIGKDEDISDSQILRHVADSTNHLHIFLKPQFRDLHFNLFSKSPISKNQIIKLHFKS